MASANNMVSPIHNWRPDEPYDYNGSAEKGWGSLKYGDTPVHGWYAQQPRKKKDIGEVGIDPEVHGMTSANNMVSPVHNWRPDEPYDYNGSAEKGWGDGSLVRKHPGISLVQSDPPPRDFDPTLKKGSKDAVREDVLTNGNGMGGMFPRSEFPPPIFDHPWDQHEHERKLKEIAKLEYERQDDERLRYFRDIIAQEEEESEAKEMLRNPDAFEEDFDKADAKRELPKLEPIVTPPLPDIDVDGPLEGEDYSDDSESSEDESESGDDYSDESESSEGSDPFEIVPV